MAGLRIYSWCIHLILQQQANPLGATIKVMVKR